MHALTEVIPESVTQSRFTDTAGQCRFEVTNEHGRLYSITVTEPTFEYATYLESFLEGTHRFHSLEDGVVECVIRLRRAGTLVVEVRDQNAELLADHQLELVYGSRDRKPGTNSRRVAFSAHDGVLVLKGLEAGPWELLAPRWKKWSQTERYRIDVKEGSVSSTSIVVEELPESMYASVVFSELVSGSVDAEGLLKGFSLERSDGRSYSTWIYADGSSYVYRFSPDLKVRAVDTEGRKGQWIPIAPGDRHLIARVEWQS